MPQPNIPNAAEMTNALDIDRLKAINEELDNVDPAVSGMDTDGMRDFTNQFSQTEQIAKDNIAELSEEINEAIDIKRASAKVFNLSKKSQTDQNLMSPPFDQDITGLQQASGNEGDLPDQAVDFDFNDIDQLKQLLDAEYEKSKNTDNHEFINEFKKEIIKKVPDTMQGTVEGALQRFFETGEEEKLRRMDLLVEIGKGFGLEDGGEETVKAPYTKASIEKAVKEANEIIKNFAKKAAASSSVKTAKAYNLQKQAQAHGVAFTEFINYGPDDKRVLPYSNTGYVGSDWHVWLRARDHNFIFDDKAIDFETFWRGNVMDKYSRPYRNEKGEYVGGYINKRFEVDRNIPEGNNLQLLPGQKRRPYMPEFATFEARLTAARKDHAKDRGYSPTETEYEPTNLYNWKVANQKKK